MGGSMARKRYQKGSVSLRGKNPVWVGRFREDIVDEAGRIRRVLKSIVLGDKKCFPTKRLAERQLDSILSRVNCVSYLPGRVATLGEFVLRWENEILAKRKPSTVRSTKSVLNFHIVPRLGKFRLEQIGAEVQQVFVNQISEKTSRKTTLNIVSTLSSILTTAKNWGYTCEEVNLDRLVLPDRGIRTKARFFTPAEVKSIIAAASEPYRTMFLILAMTGLRAGEVLGLQVGDFDFERRLITIRRSAWYGRIQTTKSTHSEAVLPMPESLAGVLQGYVANMKTNPEGFLFVTRNCRPPSSNKVVECQLWPILDALKIPRCGLHAFRHTHSSLLLDTGAAPTVAQAQLRHSDARITLGVYGHVIGDAHREAVEKVASLLFPTCSQTVQ
jgi:integrase